MEKMIGMDIFLEPEGQGSTGLPVATLGAIGQVVYRMFVASITIRREVV